MKTIASPPWLASAVERRVWYEQAFRMAKLGAWSCDLATEELTWTDGVYDLFGFSIGAKLRRRTTVDLYVEDSRSEMEAARAEALRSGRPFSLDAQIRTVRGERKWMRLTADVELRDGRPVRLFGSKQDVTEHVQGLLRLRAQAERDPLTGLANRSVFDAHYREIVRDELDHAGAAALVLVDIDRFKEINDRFGHLAGDECLRRIAERMRQVFGDAMLLARLGGDEFTVILGAPLGHARLARLLDQAAAALAGPVFWRGASIEIGVSIGAALIDAPHRRPIAKLFEEADGALYAAKNAGRATVRIHGEDGGGQIRASA